MAAKERFIVVALGCAGLLRRDSRQQGVAGWDIRAVTELCFISFVLLPMNAQAAAKSRQFFFVTFPLGTSVMVGERGDWHSAREIKPVKSSDRDSEASEKEATVADKGEVTRWLIAGSGGDARALESLLPLVYEELHRQAVSFFRRERAGHTLQPTALVNDVYLRLINQQEVSWQNRAQFFGIAAQMMRRILVSHARGREAQKRGGAAQHITLDEELATAPQRDLNLLALDDALTRLETVDPDKSRMVELRFFTGLSVEETAEVMGVSPRTVDRQWQTAKAWLHREISAGKAA